MLRILVIRFSSLGDVILTTPIYRNLKTAFPNCRVTVAVKEKYSGILEGHPNVDELLILRDGESLFSFVRRVRQGRYDTVIDLHNNLRSNLVTLFSGIPRVARYRKAIMERRLFVSKKIQDPELKRHTIDRYLDTLKPLGIEPRFYPPEVIPGAKTGISSAPLRILVIQTAFLGDAVLTTPIFEAILKFYPEARISLLCTPEIKDVFTGNNCIHEVLVMDKRGEDSGLGALWRWAGKLKDRYDVAILPHRSFRSAFLAWLSGTPKRVGFDTSQGRIFLTDTVPFDWRTHDTERNMKLLEALGITEVSPRIHVPLDAHADIRSVLEDHGIPKDRVLVGMNPGSIWETKRWLAEGFARVADALVEEYNCAVVFIGSTRDNPIVENVMSHMKREAVNLSGKTDLKTLTALIARCSLFVTNDSGPMHLAVASRVPVVSIWGPTTRELGFYPYSDNSVMVEVDLPCRPCSLHGGHKCPLDHFRCMKEVTPEMVLEHCRKFLSGKVAAGK